MCLTLMVERANRKAEGHSFAECRRSYPPEAFGDIADTSDSGSVSRQILPVRYLATL